MYAWLTNEALYRRFMNGALAIVIIAALCANNWPKYGLIAGAVTIAVTLTAVVLYIATLRNKDSNDTREQPSVAMDMSVGERQSVADTARDRGSDAVVESSEMSPETKKETAASAATTAADEAIISYLRTWSDLSERERLMMRYLRGQGDLPKHERMPRIAELHRAGWTVHEPWKPARDAMVAAQLFERLALTPAARSAFLHGAAGIGKTALAARYWTLAGTLLKERPVIGLTEKKEAGRVVVAVGPVTIEMNDDETTIHIDSTKTKVVTTVSDKPRSQSVEPADLMSSSSSPRILH